MTANYAGHSNDPSIIEVLGGIFALAFFVFLASVMLLTFGVSAIGTLAIVFYPESYAPLHMPDQPASARVANARFEPTPSDCPPYGECPHVHIMVRKENYVAFIRHLELAALNHGGAYAYDALDRRDIYTLRLPDDAAYELMDLHISKLRRELMAGYIVSPGYRLWAVRWSEERASVARGDADAFVTLTAHVAQVQRSDYYWYPVLLAMALVALSLAALFFRELWNRWRDAH